MKPSLQLKIGQQLTMTPQLQQAIRLLQLSSLELQSEIQEALESNPMLEMNEESSNPESNAEQANQKNLEKEDDSTISTDRALKQENVKEDLPVDTQWENWDAAPPSSGSNFQSDRDNQFEYQGKTTESLQDHLFWQMNLTPFTDHRRRRRRQIHAADRRRTRRSKHSREESTSGRPYKTIDFITFVEIRTRQTFSEPVM